jgi:hypothetical protein
MGIIYIIDNYNYIYIIYIKILANKFKGMYWDIMGSNI